MEIRDIPTELDGYPVVCKYLSSSDVVRIYARGSSTGATYTYQDFVILNDHLVPRGALSRTNSGFSSYTCLDDSVLTYSPESTVYFQFISFVLVVFTFIVIYRFIIRRLLP